ncbi:3',5'-cyclic adenosine monophosphate phosphodiesterase CpdA [subsurface metagenome]
MADVGRVRWRILHTSDVHLSSLGDRACHSLEAIVNLAIKTEVDLVIIAGDFFDDNRVDDNLVSFVVEQLGRLSVPTFILPGNHDPLVPESVYHRVELWQDAGNIRIFQAPQGETFTLPGLSVWGKPIVSHTGDLRPLAGIPPPQGKGQWHIAVAHGYYYVDTGPAVFPSFHITHKEIVSSGRDYIALGHCPTFRCVCDAPVKACYCDSPSWASSYGAVNIVDLIEGTGVQVSCCSL